MFRIRSRADMEENVLLSNSNPVRFFCGRMLCVLSHQQPKKNTISGKRLLWSCGINSKLRMFAPETECKLSFVWRLWRCTVPDAHLAQRTKLRSLSCVCVHVVGLAYPGHSKCIYWAIFNIEKVNISHLLQATNPQIEECKVCTAGSIQLQTARKCIRVRTVWPLHQTLHNSLSFFFFFKKRVLLLWKGDNDFTFFGITVG